MVVLTGNMHSRVAPGFARNQVYRSMGNLSLVKIAPGRLISFDVAHRGGTAWICGPDCGVVQLGGRPAVAGQVAVVLRRGEVLVDRVRRAELLRRDEPGRWVPR